MVTYGATGNWIRLGTMALDLAAPFLLNWNFWVSRRRRLFHHWPHHGFFRHVKPSIDVDGGIYHLYVDTCNYPYLLFMLTSTSSNAPLLPPFALPFAHFHAVAASDFIFSRLSFGGGATKDKNSVALSEHAGKASNPKVFFMVQIGAETKPQRIEFELFSGIVPKTAENFRCLCTGEKGVSKLGRESELQNSGFHRIIPRFMCQGGDLRITTVQEASPSMDANLKM